ncbi:DegT/DnrJ/EryC1/StrS family aminotransferase, partial [Idiomarina piscisalsi]
MIPVTKPHLPDKAKLYSYIDEIYQTERLTNNGPLHDKLKARLESYLGVENLLLVANGTLALQIAFKALNIKSDLRVKSEVITSPFSFVATASSMVWEGLKPVFCDVDKQTWCLDSQLIESHITEHTKAIVPVNIYGNACNHEEIQKVASNNGLKVIYDASHAFGVKFEGKSESPLIC